MYFTIARELIALLTFPGSIIHEVCHKFFCDLLRIRVYKVCYFRYDDTYSYLIHEPATNLRDALLILICPFLLCTLLCMILTFPAELISVKLSAPFTLNTFLLLWVGISIGMNAFPTNHAITEFQKTIQSHPAKPYIYLIANGFAILLQFIQFLRKLWIDLLYAILIMNVLPSLIF